MITTNLSSHVRNDRTDRLALIATTIGFGEIIKIKVKPGKYGDVQMCITDTGVTIIKDLNDKVITAYACRINELTFIFEGRAPKQLYRMVCTNMKKRKYLYEL